jgi:DNA-binding CsgD family transcriptional regulator
MQALRTINQEIENQEIEEIPLLPIVAKFQIADTCYLIMSLQPVINPDVVPISFLEVSRFVLNQQLYTIVTSTAKREENPLQDNNVADLLTDREFQIAILVASGKSNKEIAKQLCISAWTVSTHLRHVFTKLGVVSRAAMVYRCASLIKQQID